MGQREPGDEETEEVTAGATDSPTPAESPEPPTEPAEPTSPAADWEASGDEADKKHEEDPTGNAAPLAKAGDGAATSPGPANPTAQSSMTAQAPRPTGAGQRAAGVEPEHADDPENLKELWYLWEDIPEELKCNQPTPCRNKQQCIMCKARSCAALSPQMGQQDLVDARVAN